MRKRRVKVIRGLSGKAILLGFVFLLGGLTAGFLRAQKRGAETEERTRMVTAVTKYIKSGSYRSLLENVTWDNGRFSAEYHIEKAVRGKGYIIDRRIGRGYIKNKLFKKTLYNGGGGHEGTLCFIGGSGPDLEGATLEVDMKKTTISFDPPGASGGYMEKAGSERSSDIPEGGDRSPRDSEEEKEIIFGRVILTGVLKERAAKEKPEEVTGKNFIIIPEKKYS